MKSSFRQEGKQLARTPPSRKISNVFLEVQRAPIYTVETDLGKRTYKVKKKAPKFIRSLSDHKIHNYGPVRSAKVQRNWLSMMFRYIINRFVTSCFVYDEHVTNEYESRRVSVADYPFLLQICFLQNSKKSLGGKHQEKFENTDRTQPNEHKNMKTFKEEHSCIRFCDRVSSTVEDEQKRTLSEATRGFGP